MNRPNYGIGTISSRGLSCHDSLYRFLFLYYYFHPHCMRRHYLLQQWKTRSIFCLEYGGGHRLVNMPIVCEQDLEKKVVWFIVSIGICRRCSDSINCCDECRKNTTLPIDSEVLPLSPLIPTEFIVLPDAITPRDVSYP